MRHWLLLLRTLVLRPLRADPLRSALTVASIALGVGVVIAIELAGRAGPRPGRGQSRTGGCKSSTCRRESIAGGCEPIIHKRQHKSLDIEQHCRHQRDESGEFAQGRRRWGLDPE